MINIFPQLIAWHFYDVPKKIIRGWGNFLYFSLNYFSVTTLLFTLFSPWRKYGEGYGDFFEIGRNFETFIFNSMSRIIGAILRTIFIFLGIFFTVISFVVGLGILVLWLVVPFLIIILFIFGTKLLL